jgi:nitroreductase
LEANVPNNLPPTDVNRFLRSLRAVRRFAPTPVPDDVVEQILDVGRWTGSSKNTQPWEVVVVRNRETLRELSTLGQFAGHLAGATFAIVLVMDSPGNRFDAGRLAERLMLGGWVYGVGSCIGSIFPEANEARAKEILSIPSGKDVHTALSFGYPADSDALSVSRSVPGLARVLPSVGRKPMDKFAHRERYGA